MLAVWGACAIARRFFFRDADFVSQLLLAGIVANLAAYIPSTLADATALNVREIAPVLPFAAVLAGRMLGDRLVTGPLATIRLPRVRQAAPRHRAHSLRVRLIAAPLVVLFGWYCFGLFQQADTPAAPDPLTNVAAFLEKYHLTYGLGGYWEASVLTVETGGAVTVRAVTPACLQPYQWESKQDWYDPTKHAANFILLSEVPGYFNKFAVSGAALTLLDTWSKPPFWTKSRPPAFYDQPGSPPAKYWPAHLNTGGFFLLPRPNAPPAQIWYYTARVYPMNLLTRLPTVNQLLTSPPPWLKRLLTKTYGPQQMAKWYGAGLNPCS